MDSEHAAASMPPAPTEEEALLPKQELEQLKEAFFRRYHLRPEPRQFPSHRLLSKLSRQLTRNQFEVMDLWTVRSLAFQRTHSQKRRRLTSNLYLQEDDDDEPTTKSWLSYMAKMDTYFLALAIVGCRPVEPAPTAPESLLSDSLNYVQVPYDVLLSYSSRCHDLVLRTPEGRRLQLLQHLDVEEPGQWAARRTGSATLRTIISAVMAGRSVACRGPACTQHCQVGRHQLQHHMQPPGIWAQQSSASVMGHSSRAISAINAAPRRTAHAAHIVVGLCCSLDGCVAPSSTHPLGAPKPLEKRVAPLPGGRGQPLDTPVFEDFRSFLDESESVDMHKSKDSPRPILLDIFRGVHAPLSKAFLWCQWEIITPIDIEID